MRPDGPEFVVWRSDTQRCELWTIRGDGYLRVYSGDTIIHEERVRDRPVQQAGELRGRMADNPQSESDDPE